MLTSNFMKTIKDIARDAELASSQSQTSSDAIFKYAPVVERDIPKKVIDCGFGPYQCPTCTKDVANSMWEFCPYCGQKLDWRFNDPE